ncbi:MAG: site-specific integrase [bacterium]|nr:site-specific integrase [bacterium]
MSIRKIRNSWWTDFRFNGTRFRKRSPANSKEGAKDYESLLRQKLVRGENLEGREDKGDITFEKFSQEWFEVYVKNNNKHSEVISKESILRVHLLPFFGKMRLSKIQSLKIEEYKRQKIQSGLSNKTTNNHLAVLNKSLGTAKEWQFIKDYPRIKLLKLKPLSHDYLSESECEILLNGATGIIKEMILLALRTGLRFGEIIALGWKDVDLERKMLSVSKSISKGLMGSTKSNRSRYIPLSQELYEMLSRRSQKSGFIFVNQDGTPKKQIPCCKALYRACRQSKLREIGWHTLRHTFASHLAQKGISLKAIQELLGHSNIQTTMRYAHLSPTELRSAIDCLEPKDNFGQQMGNASQFSLNMLELKKSGKIDFLPVYTQKADTEVSTLSD